jgi:hypothetical protein
MFSFHHSFVFPSFYSVDIFLYPSCFLVSLWYFLYHTTNLCPCTLSVILLTNLFHIPCSCYHIFHTPFYSYFMFLVDIFTPKCCILHITICPSNMFSVDITLSTCPLLIFPRFHIIYRCSVISPWHPFFFKFSYSYFLHNGFISLCISITTNIMTTRNVYYIYEPCHDKTEIVRLRPAWIQTSLRIRAVWSGFMLFTYQLYYK